MAETATLNSNLTPSGILANPNNSQNLAIINQNLNERNALLAPLNANFDSLINTISKTYAQIITIQNKGTGTGTDNNKYTKFTPKYSLFLKVYSLVFPHDQPNKIDELKETNRKLQESIANGNFFTNENNNFVKNYEKYRGFITELKQAALWMAALITWSKDSGKPELETFANSEETNKVFTELRNTVVTTKKIQNSDDKVITALAEILGLSSDEIDALQGRQPANGHLIILTPDQKAALNTFSKIFNHISTVTREVSNFNTSFVAGLEQQAQQGSLDSSVGILSSIGTTTSQAAWANYQHSKTKYKENKTQGDFVTFGVDNSLPTLKNLKIGIFGQVGNGKYQQQYFNHHYQIKDTVAGAGTYLQYTYPVKQAEIFARGLLGVSNHNRKIESPDLTTNTPQKTTISFTGFTAAAETGFNYQLPYNLTTGASAFYAVNHLSGADIEQLNIKDQNSNLQNVGANIKLGYALSNVNLDLNVNYTHIKYPALKNIKTNTGITNDNRFGASLSGKIGFKHNQSLNANVGYKQYHRAKNKGVDFGITYQYQF